MTYYVDLDSADVADQLWAKCGNIREVGNTHGNSGHQGGENEASPEVATDYQACTYDSEGDGTRTRNHRIDSPIL